MAPGRREGSCLGMGNFPLVFGGSRGDALTTETWVTALTGLVGLVAAVAAPVLRLNSAITRLSTLIDRALQDMGELKAAQAQLEQRATESQNALRRRIDQTRDRLHDHESRLCLLETHRGKET